MVMMMMEMIKVELKEFCAGGGCETEEDRGTYLDMNRGNYTSFA